MNKLIAVAAALLAGGLGSLSIFRNIELDTYDRRVAATARPAAPADRISLVLIDNDSLRRMEPLVGRWPWPRLVHATVIDYLAAAGAKVIAYDVLFPERDIRKFMVGDTEWTGEESDAALVESTQNAGNVVHVAEAASAELIDPSKELAQDLSAPALNVTLATPVCVQARPRVTPPFPALAQASRGIGHTLMILDADGPVRRVAPVVQVGERTIPSLSLAASERIRTRYGVVQDPGVHRYVALVGTVLAQASTRPNLSWTFIVLDTDGVNAFAAPGGYVHITRGALALIKNEAELAGVLGHEIIHITEKHTVRAIQKNQAVQMGAAETLSGSAALMDRVVAAVYENIVERGFGRGEENESDEQGVALANKVGYAPNGLVTFLTTLKDRNKESKEKRGLFASHPEMQDRLDRIKKQIASKKLTATATVATRYTKIVSYKPVPVSAIATVDPGAAGLTGGDAKAEEKKAEEKKAEEPKKGRFGLSRMLPTGGGEKKQAQVTASGGARGVDPEKDSKGGSNPKIVPVKLVAADITAFKKEGGLP